MYRQPPNRANNRSASLSGTQMPVVTSSTASTSPDNGETSMKMVAKEALSQALGVHPAFVCGDLQRCLHRLHDMSEEGQDLVRFLILRRRFQDWLSDPKSMAFLVNGGQDDPKIISPVTYLSANLLRDLGKVKQTLTLHFFCSLHTSTAGNITDNAAGMLKAFIVQLLEGDIVWDLTFLDRTQLDLIKEGTDWAVLWETFEKMLLQLTNETFVVCVIDNISYYESSGRRQDFVHVIHKLIKMTRRLENPFIKVLLTCHGRSQAVKECFAKNEVLDESVSFQADQQGLSSSAWNRIMKVAIQMLEHEIKRNNR